MNQHGDLEPPISPRWEGPPEEPGQRRPGRFRPFGRRLGVAIALGLLCLALVGAGAFVGYIVLEAPRTAPAQNGAKTASNSPGSQNQSVAAAPAQPTAGQTAGPSSRAQPVPGEPAAASNEDAGGTQGAPPKVETIQDWILVCPAEPATGPCFLQQRLATSDGKTVLIWAIRKDSSGVVHAVWQTVAGVEVSRGFVVDIGDGHPRAVPFEGCNAQNCTVRAILAPEYLQSLRTATDVTAEITMTPSNQVLRLKLSAHGLAEGLQRLEVPAQ